MSAFINLVALPLAWSYSLLRGYFRLTTALYLCFHLFSAAFSGTKVRSFCRDLTLTEFAWLGVYRFLLHNLVVPKSTVRLRYRADLWCQQDDILYRLGHAVILTFILHYRKQWNLVGRMRCYYWLWWIK